MSKYVPNYDFLTVEDINTVILNEGVEFEGYYDLDTTLLEYDQQRGYISYRHDFVVVSKIVRGNQYEYILEIRNALWDGTYSFIKLPDGFGSPTVTQVLSSPNILRISGENLYYFTIRLHLSNNSENRVIGSNRLRVIGLKNTTNLYYKTDTVPITVTDLNGEEIVNATVKLEGEGLTTWTGKTSANGKCDVIYPAANPGDYKAIVTVTSDKGSFKKVLNIRRLKLSLNPNIIQSKKLIKGSYNTVTFNLGENELDTWNFMEGINVTLQTRGKKQTSTIKKDGTAQFTINLREYYNDLLECKLTVEETGYTYISTKTIWLNCDYFYATDYASLEAECENKYGTDLIRLYYADKYDYTSDGVNMIYIDRKIIIEGEKTNNGWTTLDGAGNGYFEIKNGGTLELYGIHITNANPAIYQWEGSSLLIENCLFTGNNNEKHHGMGSCVYCHTTDNSKRNKKLYYSYIRNSCFGNNYGSCFAHAGQLDIRHCDFIKTDFKWFHQPEPFIVSQRYGDCAICDCRVDIDTRDGVSSSNSSYAKIVAYIGKTASLNGKTGLQMKGDNTLNFFGSNYRNQAHIYTKYHYPYLEGNPILVASPLLGKETRACGHAVEGVNWAYKDGYQLTRASWNKDNKKRQLTIEYPKNGGKWEA